MGFRTQRIQKGVLDVLTSQLHVFSDFTWAHDGKIWQRWNDLSIRMELTTVKSPQGYLAGFRLWPNYWRISLMMIHVGVQLSATGCNNECNSSANECELTIELKVQVSDFPHKASRSRSFLRTTWPSGSTLNISVEVSDWTNCLSILSFGNRFCPTLNWSL